MPLSPKDALEAARNVWGARQQEKDRLAFIRGALKPRRYADSVITPADQFAPTYGYDMPQVELPKQAPQAMQRLAWKARTNFLPLVLDTFSQVMKVDGYSSKSVRDGGPWQYAWQPNQLDARQTGIHRDALAYGAAYALVLPGDTAPSIEGYSPHEMTAVYRAPTRDQWPMFALRVDGNLMHLYDDECEYLIGVENTTSPISALGVAASMMVAQGVRWDFIETRHHDLGVCPVVRFRDRMLLAGDEVYGIIEPLVDIQHRIDETVFGQLVAQFYTNFQQRVIAGWVPQDESEQLRANASEFWTFTDPNTKVTTLPAGSPDPYLKAKDSGLRDMAAIAQVPAQSLGTDGISNISADTLTALETGKDRKSAEIITSLGESWEQVLRLAATTVGDDAASQDMAAQMRWKNTTAISIGQMSDALVKWVTSLGVPVEVARQWLPGWNDDLEAETKRIGPTAPDDPLNSFLDRMGRQQSDSTPTSA